MTLFTVNNDASVQVTEGVDTATFELDMTGYVFGEQMPGGIYSQFSEGVISVRIHARNAEIEDFSDFDGITQDGVPYWEVVLDENLQASRTVAVSDDMDMIYNEYIYFYLETNVDAPEGDAREVRQTDGLPRMSQYGGYLPNLMIINNNPDPEPEPVVPPTFSFQQNPDTLEIQENDTQEYSLGSLTSSNVDGESYSFTLHTSGGPDGYVEVPGNLVIDEDGTFNLGTAAATLVDGDVDVKVWFTPEFDVAEGTTFTGPGFSEEDAFDIRIVDTDGSGNPAPTPEPTPEPEPSNVWYGISGNDFKEGGAGDQEMHGLDGDDYLYGNEGKDLITGGYGHDAIFGGKDNDELYGNQGNDWIQGNRGDDIVYGGQGDDWLYGNQGADRIFGNKGRDSIWAGQDNDYIDGGEGDDWLLGNKGADVFHLSQGYDIVYDFDSLEGDSIETHVGSGTGHPTG